MFFYTIFLALLMAVTCAQDTHIFDFAKMPSCALRCDKLLKVERNCLRIPPPAGISALVCVCTSPELHALFSKGTLCLPTCNFEEGELIHLYFKDFCDGLQPVASRVSPPTPTTRKSSSSSTSPSATTSPPSTLSPLPIGPTFAIDLPSPPPSTTNIDSKAEVHKTWASAHAKYLIIAGAMIGATLAALLLAVFILHHRHRKAARERAFQQNGLFPLQPLSPRQTPLPPSPPPSEENLTATVTSSPLETSPSSHSFGDTMRAYDQDELEREQACLRRNELRKYVARAIAEGNQAI